MVSERECAQPAEEKFSEPEGIKKDTSCQLKSKLGRLKKSSEFRKLYNKAHPVDGALFILYAAPNSLGINKLGVSCSKAKIPLATKRNRIKRLIKQAMISSNSIKQGFDVIIVVRKIKAMPNLLAVKKDIYNLLKIKGLYKTI